MLATTIKGIHPGISSTALAIVSVALHAKEVWHAASEEFNPSISLTWLFPWEIIRKVITKTIAKTAIPVANWASCVNAWPFLSIFFILYLSSPK